MATDLIQSLFTLDLGALASLLESPAGKAACHAIVNVEEESGEINSSTLFKKGMGGAAVRSYCPIHAAVQITIDTFGFKKQQQDDRLEMLRLLVDIGGADINAAATFDMSSAALPPLPSVEGGDSTLVHRKTALDIVLDSMATVGNPPVYPRLLTFLIEKGAVPSCASSQQQQQQKCFSSSPSVAGEMVRPTTTTTAWENHHSYQVFGPLLYCFFTQRNVEELFTNCPHSAFDRLVSDTNDLISAYCRHGGDINASLYFKNGHLCVIDSSPFSSSSEPQPQKMVIANTVLRRACLNDYVPFAVTQHLLCCGADPNQIEEGRKQSVLVDFFTIRSLSASLRHSMMAGRRAAGGGGSSGSFVVDVLVVFDQHGIDFARDLKQGLMFTIANMQNIDTLPPVRWLIMNKNDFIDVNEARFGSTILTRLIPTMQTDGQATELLDLFHNHARADFNGTGGGLDAKPMPITYKTNYTTVQSISHPMMRLISHASLSKDVLAHALTLAGCHRHRRDHDGGGFADNDDAVVKSVPKSDAETAIPQNSFFARWSMGRLATAFTQRIERRMASYTDWLAEASSSSSSSSSSASGVDDDDDDDGEKSRVSSEGEHDGASNYFRVIAEEIFGFISLLMDFGLDVLRRQDDLSDGLLTKNRSITDGQQQKEGGGGGDDSVLSTTTNTSSSVCKGHSLLSALVFECFRVDGATHEVLKALIAIFVQQGAMVSVGIACPCPPAAAAAAADNINTTANDGSPPRTGGYRIVATTQHHHATTTAMMMRPHASLLTHVLNMACPFAGGNGGEDGGRHAYGGGGGGGGVAFRPQRTHRNMSEEALERSLRGAIYFVNLLLDAGADEGTIMIGADRISKPAQLSETCASTDGGCGKELSGAVDHITSQHYPIVGVSSVCAEWLGAIDGGRGGGVSPPAATGGGEWGGGSDAAVLLFALLANLSGLRQNQ